jgi:hypothetical protein
LELKAALAQVRTRIAQHRKSRQLNEQNTKATLIDPVIRALGWDLEDLEDGDHPDLPLRWIHGSERRWLPIA